MTGTQLIRAERLRQQRKLGWTRDHDEEHHQFGQLAEMAAFLASAGKAIEVDGAGECKIVASPGWDITPHDRINELVKAGALIAAEIDRLLRIESYGD